MRLARCTALNCLCVWDWPKNTRTAIILTLETRSWLGWGKPSDPLDSVLFHLDQSRTSISFHLVFLLTGIKKSILAIENVNGMLTSNLPKRAASSPHNPMKHGQTVQLHFLRLLSVWPKPLATFFNTTALRFGLWFTQTQKSRVLSMLAFQPSQLIHQKLTLAI